MSYYFHIVYCSPFFVTIYGPGWPKSIFEHFDDLSNINKSVYLTRVLLNAPSGNRPLYFASTFWTNEASWRVVMNYDMYN